jgi:hypothetical protein
VLLQSTLCVLFNLAHWTLVDDAQIDVHLLSMTLHALPALHELATKHAEKPVVRDQHVGVDKILY